MWDRIDFLTPCFLNPLSAGTGLTDSLISDVIKGLWVCKSQNSKRSSGLNNHGNEKVPVKIVYRTIF